MYIRFLKAGLKTMSIFLNISFIKTIYLQKIKCLIALIVDFKKLKNYDSIVSVNKTSSA